MVYKIFLTIFLVFLNGFFVAAEFAIVKVRMSQIMVRKEDSWTARIAESVVSNLDGYLAATQLGITLASLGLGWIGESVVSQIILETMNFFGVEMSEDLAHRIALPLAFVTITILHIVFGELAPKSVAIRFPINTTLLVSAPLKVFYWVFRPFIYILNGLANLLLKLVGIQPVPHAEIHSEEELKLIIAESAEGGAIEASERELIQNVFEFDDRVVRQILKPRTQIEALDVEMPLEDAVQQVLDEGYSRFPVYENNIDEVIGFVHSKDMLKAQLQGEPKTLRELIRPILMIPVTKKISQVLRLFQREHVQMAIVINEFGGTVGLLTLEDIVEELVGEIQDEYDEELPMVEKADEHTFRIYAQNPIDEINAYLPEPFPESESYVTLAGLILEKAETIPNEGDEISIGNYQVKMLRMMHSSPEYVEVKRKQ